MTRLEQLKDLIFAMDNRACFIERERILHRLVKEMADYTGEDKYALALARLLSEVSTPIEACDYFAGRVVEDLPEEEWKDLPETVWNGYCGLLWSHGHVSFDYEKVLRMGLRGILEEIQTNAQKKGDPDSLSFAKNAEIVITAIREYATRYAVAAEEKGLDRMAQALRKVPYEPAGDFFSALQGIWLLHMIASCYEGSRDFAFGRFDQYMFPFYQKALQDGQTEEELTELLAGFFLKCNEICGRCADNYAQKPIPCNSSNQYVNIGGDHPNAFSSVALKAAMRNDMVQPVITVLLQPDADEFFTKAVFEAQAALTGKMQIFHYDIIVKGLLEKGIPEEIARDFTYSACCTLDLNYHTIRQEYYVPTPQIFVRILHEKEYASLEELLTAYRHALTEDMQKAVDWMQCGRDPEKARQTMVLDALLLSDTAAECRYACDGKAPYNTVNLFCSAIATLGDSLMVLDKLVFREKRYTYGEFTQILRDNFVGHEDLLDEIKGYPKFGNDTEVDAYTTLAGNVFVGATEDIVHGDNFYMIPGFYSLDRNNSWRWEVPATPDGRRNSEPFSENQSPTYGTDKQGITALLKSISKLPFVHAMCGGLNLTLSQKVSSEVLQSLILSYFQMGGLHAGVSILDRATFEDARVHPECYPTLTVRLYGFSEYFTSLPDWHQEAILNRTQY